MADQSPPVFVLACVSCGKTVSGSEAKCPRCGASFEDVCFECPFCGDIVSAGQSRCDKCGTEFSIFAEAVDEASSLELDGPSDSAALAEAPEAAAPAEPVQPAEAAETSDYECPACGKPVGEKDEQCPHCGARFSE
mgnify:FL=1